MPSGEGSPKDWGLGDYPYQYPMSINYGPYGFDAPDRSPYPSGPDTPERCYRKCMNEYGDLELCVAMYLPEP
jgi:hypothetical protein